MRSSKIILITGASGFIGTWMADKATEAGFKVIGIDLRAPFKPQIWENFSTSSLENVDLIQLLEGYILHAVVHLAGGASVFASTKDPYGDFSSLLPGTARLALYLTKFQPQARLYLFSSAAVYGNPQTLPISEMTPILPISAYGVHKATAETLLLHYARILGLNLTIFRVFSVYGPGLRKQLIWDVCQRAINAHKQNERYITLFGTGEETRDFIYIADLCQAVLTIVNDQTNTQIETYNLASGTESRIAKVTRSLIEYLEIDIKIIFDGSLPKGDPANWKADISCLNKHNFRCQYTLNDGLREIVAWVRSIDSI